MEVKVTQGTGNLEIDKIGLPHRDSEFKQLSIIQADSLSSKNFTDLRNGTVQALVIENFISPDVCDVLAHRLSAARRPGYSNMPKERLEKIGITVFEYADRVQKDVFAKQHYLNESHFAKKQLADFARYSGCQWPFEKLREAFKQHANAQALQVGEIKAFAGITRIVRDSSEIYPHQDELGVDLPENQFALELKSSGVQVAANLYLTMPRTGGQLELWDRHLGREELALYQLPKAVSQYGLDREKLGSPDQIISPKPGQLILFDSTKVHAVAPAHGEIPRVSISCFIGLTDNTARYWS